MTALDWTGWNIISSWFKENFHYNLDKLKKKNIKKIMNTKQKANNILRKTRNINKISRK